MIRTIALTATVAAGTVSAQVFTDEAAFNAQLVSSFTDDFSSIPTGLQPSYSNSGNGFSFTATGVAGADGPGGTGELFNDPGILSLNSATDALFIEFGPGATAVGGNFFASDINFLEIPALVTVDFNDGSSVSTATGGGFFGFVNLGGISSLTIDASDATLGGPAWPTASSLTVGAAVPAPASALALVGLAAARRRRA